MWLTDRCYSARELWRSSPDRSYGRRTSGYRPFTSSPQGKCKVYGFAGTSGEGARSARRSLKLTPDSRWRLGTARRFYPGSTLVGNNLRPQQKARRKLSPSLSQTTPDVAATSRPIRLLLFGLPLVNFYKFDREGTRVSTPRATTTSALKSTSTLRWSRPAAPPALSISSRQIPTSPPSRRCISRAVTLGAHIVSNSWFCMLGCGQMNLCFDAPGVNYLAAAGDYGYASYSPMAFGSVVWVGGTHLVDGSGKRGWTETVWGGSGFVPGGLAAAAPVSRSRRGSTTQAASFGWATTWRRSPIVRRRFAL